MKRSLLVALSFVIVLNAYSTDWTVKTIPDPKNAPSKIFVSDPDQLIDDATEAQINAICWDLEEQAKVQFGIVIVNSIGDETPKTFASELFNYWGIGKGGSDNGLLLMIVINQRRYEFETGYGLEGDLPDWACVQIGTNNLIPYMKQQDYSSGVLYSALAVRNYLFQKYNITAGAYDSLFVGADVVLPVAETSNSEYDYDPNQSNESTYTPIDYSTASFGEILAGSLADFWWVLTIQLIAMVIWAYVNKSARKSNKHKRDRPDNPMHPILFYLTASLPFIFWISYAINPFISYDNYFLALLGTVYLSVFIIITDFRIRVNKKILHTSYDLYHKWSDLTESNKYWVIFATFFFPVFYIPYLFWFFTVRNKLRKASRPCKKCATELHFAENVIEELKDDTYLSKGQIKEEYLTSRDWDVWLCKSCSQTEILGYKKLFTSYDTCPSCKFITEKYMGSETIVAPTYESSGTGKRKYSCQNCGNYRETTYTIAKLTKSSSSGSGGSSYSSGGGGSSWGGGRSGGGGGGGSW